MTSDLRAELARHQDDGGASTADPRNGPDYHCRVCWQEWPCDASRALAALDTAEQERAEGLRVALLASPVAPEEEK